MMLSLWSFSWFVYIHDLTLRPSTSPSLEHHYSYQFLLRLLHSYFLTVFLLILLLSLPAFYHCSMSSEIEQRWKAGSSPSDPLTPCHTHADSSFLLQAPFQLLLPRSHHHNGCSTNASSGKSSHAFLSIITCLLLHHHIHYHLPCLAHIITCLPLTYIINGD
jgi:hypothetical protein